MKIRTGAGVRGVGVPSIGMAPVAELGGDFGFRRYGRGADIGMLDAESFGVGGYLSGFRIRELGCGDGE